MPGGQRPASQSRQAQSRQAQSRQSQSRQAQSRQAQPRQAQPGGSVDEGKIAEAIRPVVTDAGMDLEAIRVTAAGRRRLLRVVVDSDNGVSLDDAAAISRQLSAALDEAAVMGEFPYTLEVSSPGVDRPLTDPRHWRRAVGRLVKVAVTDTGATSGRILSADPDGVTLDVEGARRHFSYAVLGAGAIQVEFGHPQTELGATGDGH